MTAPERLQKLLSRAGIMSRRQADTLLQAGRLHLNGQPARPGDRAVAGVDSITLDGQPVHLAAAQQQPRRTLLLHKPPGVLCTCRDPHGRPTVLELLPPAVGQGLYPVGRLDRDSEGALLLTNDGDLALRLTHPRHGHSKTYRAWLVGIPSANRLAAWRSGLLLDGRRTRPAQVELEHRSATGSCLRIVLREGRKRQIRRIADQLGHPVRRLQRLALGALALGSLASGSWRWLKTNDMNLLLDQEAR
ncbi:MAG: rRNA pseudouridine synthase [Synechococcus sp. SB0667_bin_8]|nr:rRNA pseudouridine synthase [Synechococcus sp. SB0667_bin_8]